ncbi:ankyrin repeat and BTB/POZ domain-containing protein 1-like isoform X2 [Amphiura filiformis]|uniref:ankyrin repeat and BTB/POZ domain-containing protein 1-like isoform X1 n=1 Tax=Amphiura filiformis TaxID=82378 RepID=UPI003B214864
MDRKSEVFHCCKVGDLQRVQYLVEVKEVELNIRDKFDSTPLYYACLCGHKDLVQYLLECGARCEAKTFDGERCLYGALTDEIRDILKNYKAVKVGKTRRDLYLEFLERLQEPGCYEDIAFVVHDKTYTAHRCILHARSHYFAEMLDTKWRNKETVNIKHSQVRPQAFKAVLQYIYTGHLEVHVDCVDDCITFAKYCKMSNLEMKLIERLQAILNFVPQKPGTEINVISIEPGMDDTSLQDDLEYLADLAIPLEVMGFVGPGELPFCGEPGEAPPLADVCFSVEGHHFYCHKVFFCGRSDYFKALLSDHFSENAQDQHSIPVVTLHDITAEVFSHVVYYLYTNRVELSEDTSYDVLCIADLYLLPGLKKLCANVIGQTLTDSSVISVLRVSRMFDLNKLEDQCAEYMAKHLERILDKDEFTALIQEDAASVKDREEMDSIMIVDDIRYHISANVQTFSNIREAEDKLKALDELLIQMGMEC